MIQLLGRIAPLLVALLSASAIAQTTKPSEKVWDLPGLHGTTAQIREQVLREPRELEAGIIDAKAAVKFSDDDIAKCKVYLAKKLAESNRDYGYVCKTISDADSELSAPTNMNQIERLQNKRAGFERRKQAIEDREFPKDKELASLLSRRAARQGKVDSLGRSLAKAIAWRQKIANAILGTLIFHHAAPGDTGLVGRVSIKEVSSGIVVAEGAIFLPVSEDAAKEGITTIRGQTIPTTFVIRGIDTKDLKEGSKAVLDQIVEITESKAIGVSLVVVAKRKTTEADSLLELFHQWQLVEYDQQ